MKEGWEIKKLGEVCDKITDGSHNPPKGIASSSYIMISSQNIGTNSLDIQNVRFLSKEDFENENKRTKIECGDILLTIVGTIGRAYVVANNDKNIVLQRSVAVIKPKTILSPFYVRYYFVAKNEELNKEAHGVAQKGIYLKQLSSIPIPVPPLSEQQRIVSELDCISGIIEKKKQQLTELDNLAQAIFYDMFGDPEDSQYQVLKLSELTNHKLSYGSGASAIPYDGKCRYVRITDIQDDGTLDDNVVSPNSVDAKYLLHDGDLLFARSGATVGKTYLYSSKDGNCIYAGYLIRFIPNTDLVLPIYTFYYTKTIYYKTFIEKNAQAVAQPNINAQQYGNLSVPLPPLSLQQSFAAKVEAIEKQKALIKQSIGEAETLLTNRMDYYFN